MRARQWLQFNLRWAFVILTACGVWLGVFTKSARRERAGLRAVESLKAEIWYEHEGAPEFIVLWGEDCQLVFANHRAATAPAPGPEWLRRILGDEYFTRVVGLSLSGREVGDSDMTAIAKLAGLSRIDLSGTKVVGARLSADGRARLQAALPACKID